MAARLQTRKADTAARKNLRNQNRWRENGNKNDEVFVAQAKKRYLTDRGPQKKRPATDRPVALASTMFIIAA